MTYLGAANTADDAATLAKRARASFDDDANQLLAMAVSKLAEAVSELAGSLHRDH